MSSDWSAVRERLHTANAPEIVIRIFHQHYSNLCSGSDGFLAESEIEPATEIADAETLDDSFRSLGMQHLDSAAILKLNGGLGTSMGMEGPKSLLPIRGQETFLGLIVRQSQQLSVPLVLMNSFSTAEQTGQAIRSMTEVAADIRCFMQHQVPKIDAETLMPVQWPADPALQWCPPGHGDIYAALVTSGTMEKLLTEGRRYVFVSNADNLGATLDPRILGSFISSGKSFLMEVADRTVADRKGGHLARRKDGQLVLREKAQCRPDEEHLFQDITRHRFFNTNNLWLDLVALQDHLNRNHGVLSLPTIVNRKTVDPTDASSPVVFQLETAMGAAIEVFADSDAIRVPRSRFAPVKTTGDLLAVRSDAYELLPDHSVALISKRHGTPPDVQLDDRFFKTIADLSERFLATPSLCDCNTFSVTGNLFFPAGVVIQGDAKLTGPELPVKVPPGIYFGETPFHSIGSISDTESTASNGIDP